jgi:methylmalonyl-CoA mutase, N-terminal domain
VAHESGAINTVDPLAGSYYVESLTSRIEQESWELIAKIDAMGGSVAAIEQGFMQEAIAKSAYKYQKEIESGKKIIVGMNKFQIQENHDTPILRVDDSIREGQSARLRELRSRREQAACDKALAEISRRAKSGENFMPAVIDAVEKLCTLGEISDTLRKEFGEYH